MLLLRCDVKEMQNLRNHIPHRYQSEFATRANPLPVPQVNYITQLRTSDAPSAVTKYHHPWVNVFNSESPSRSPWSDYYAFLEESFRHKFSRFWKHFFIIKYCPIGRRVVRRHESSSRFHEPSDEKDQCAFFKEPSVVNIIFSYLMRNAHWERRSTSASISRGLAISMAGRTLQPRSELPQCKVSWVDLRASEDASFQRQYLALLGLWRVSRGEET
jgi:hypothetical protein